MCTRSPSVPEASSDDIQGFDQHSWTGLLIRRFGVRIPGGPRSKPQVDGLFCRSPTDALLCSDRLQTVLDTTSSCGDLRTCHRRWEVSPRRSVQATPPERCVVWPKSRHRPAEPRPDQIDWSRHRARLARARSNCRATPVVLSRNLAISMVTPYSVATASGSIPSATACNSSGLGSNRVPPKLVASSS